MVVSMMMAMMVLIKTNDTDTSCTDTNLLTLCGFDPGGDGVWRRSSSDELEFLGKFNIYVFSMSTSAEAVSSSSPTSISFSFTISIFIQILPKTMEPEEAKSTHLDVQGAKLWPKLGPVGHS